jgi:hypothetical protein
VGDGYVGRFIPFNLWYGAVDKKGKERRLFFPFCMLVFAEDDYFNQNCCFFLHPDPLKPSIFPLF